jgi:hypothetical protein
MSTVAPKGRQYLSADALFGLVRSGFADIPAARPSETDIALSDALLSAFALCSLTSPALRAFDQERPAGHVARLSGMERVPCDTHLRERREPLSPASLRPLCKSVLRQRQRGQALEPMTCLEGHY